MRARWSQGELNKNSIGAQLQAKLEEVVDRKDRRLVKMMNVARVLGLLRSQTGGLEQ